MANQTLVRSKRAADAPRSASPQGQRTALRRNPRFLLVIVIALVVAVVGAGELAAMVRARSEPINGDTATVGGLTIHLERVEWVSFDSDDPTLSDPKASNGYSMPSQMMPDMPTDGNARLNLEVVLDNSTGDGRTLDTDKEFWVGGGKDDKLYKLQGDTFGGLGRVNPGDGVNGKLFFDMPPTGKDDPPLYLEWRRGGDTVRVFITPGGKPSQHSH